MAIKKSRLISAMLILVILLTIGWLLNWQYNSANPPSPTITAAKQQIPSWLGSHCWHTLRSGQCSDMPSPPEMIKLRDVVPVVVKPGAKLKVAYNKKPQNGSFGVNRWSSAGLAEPVRMDGATLTVPTEAGVYVYDAHGRWRQGDAIHAFIIEVR